MKDRPTCYSVPAAPDSNPPIRYVVTRERAPDYAGLFKPLTPEQIRAEAEQLADWLALFRAHRSEIARSGGLATKGISTPAKRRASRANGNKGGRPRRSSQQTV